MTAADSSLPPRGEAVMALQLWIEMLRREFSAAKYPASGGGYEADERVEKRASTCVRVNLC
jgi:hypothetical protein